MRPEQKKAVELTSKYFKKNISKNTKPPHYLWNAKMRFGKILRLTNLQNQ